MHGGDNTSIIDSTETLFEEAALVLYDGVPPSPSVLPANASKTPTNNVPYSGKYSLVQIFVTNIKTL